MPDPLVALENRRREILDQLAELGDMRVGSLSENYRRCGKPGCVCASPDHPGHGPYVAFTRKLQGKTRTRSYSPGPALERTRRQVSEYRRFRALSRQLLDVNERICDARDVGEAVSGREKKRPTSSGKRSAGK